MQDKVNAAVSQGVNRFYIDEPIRLNIQWLVNASVPFIASKGGTLTIYESYFDDGFGMFHQLVEEELVRWLI